MVASGGSNTSNSGALSFSSNSVTSASSGNLSFFSGSSGSSSGNLSISSGDSSASSSGAISLLVGDSVSTTGGSINLDAGDSTGATGGNIYLKAGSGSLSGSVYLVHPVLSSNFGIISHSTFDFSGLSSLSMSSTGTVEFLSSTTMTLEATNGISMGDSNVYGYETGNGTVGDVISGQVTINAMAGKITSEDTSLPASDIDPIILHNDRVTLTSLVVVTVSDSGGCQPVVYEAYPSFGQVAIKVKNIAETACTHAFTLIFWVIN